MDPGVRPRLRAVEAFPVTRDGERLVALRDPGGFTDQVALLPPAAVEVVALLDGQHSLQEIRRALGARHGSAPSEEAIRRLVAGLDEAGFLDGPRFRERQQAIEREFRDSATRPAAHAGSAYAGDAKALRAQIDSFYTHPEGPGAPGVAGRQPAPPLRGIIAPHIDFHRGGPTYAWAYRELVAREDFDCFVVLGTCHTGMPDPFAITLKPFETPLGRAEVDRDFCEALGRRYGHDLLSSELAHRQEHSVEFQAVMLRHVLGPGRPFTIVPLLASFLHEAVWRGSDPEADTRVPRFIDALLGTMATAGRRVCLVAGVDLAHVGPRFGDAEPNTPVVLEGVHRADRSMLEAVVGSEPAAFYASVARDRDARRICGLSPIYTFLRALPGISGRLLRYSQWPDPEGTVSFCAAAFP